jgi:putative ABC transport system permease protein
LREVLRRKGRSYVVVSGYCLAIAAFVVLVSMLYHSKTEADRILTSTGTHFIAFVPACVAGCDPIVLSQKGEGFVVNGVPSKPIPMKFVHWVREFSTVRDASPFLLYRFKDAKYGTFTVGGFDVANNVAVATTSCAETDLTRGRFLKPGDRGMVLIEKAYSRSRIIDPGDKIQIGNRHFTVVGEVNPGIRPAKADVYMGFEEAETLIRTQMKQPDLKDVANIVLVEVKSSQVQDKAIRLVKSLIPGAVVSSYGCYKPAAKVMGIGENSVWLLAVALGVCTVLFAMKSQMASVIERRHDIGILKAIGWTNGEVLSMVLSESILLSLAGGALGCLAALIVFLAVPSAALAGSNTGPWVLVSPYVFPAAFLLALIGGLTAGSLPAMRAARLRPVEALRKL